MKILTKYDKILTLIKIASDKTADKVAKNMEVSKSAPKYTRKNENLKELLCDIFEKGK